MTTILCQELDFVRRRSTHKKTRVPLTTVRLALASYCRTRPNDASDGRAAVMCELLPGEQASENKKC